MKPGDNARDYYNWFVKTYRQAHPGCCIREGLEEHIERGLPHQLQDEVMDEGLTTLGVA